MTTATSPTFEKKAIVETLMAYLTQCQTDSETANPDHPEDINIMVNDAAYLYRVANITKVLELFASTVMAAIDDTSEGTADITQESSFEDVIKKVWAVSINPNRAVLCETFPMISAALDALDRRYLDPETIKALADAQNSDGTGELEAANDGEDPQVETDAPQPEEQ